MVEALCGPKQREDWEMHLSLVVSLYSTRALASPFLLPGSPSNIVVPLLGFPAPPQLMLQTPGTPSQSSWTHFYGSNYDRLLTRCEVQLSTPAQQHWNVRLCKDFFFWLILESSLYWLLCVNEQLGLYLHTLLVKSLSHHSVSQLEPDLPLTLQVWIAHEP